MKLRPEERREVERALELWRRDTGTDGHDEVLQRRLGDLLIDIKIDRHKRRLQLERPGKHTGSAHAAALRVVLGSAWTLWWCGMLGRGDRDLSSEALIVRSSASYVQRSRCRPLPTRAACSSRCPALMPALRDRSAQALRGLQDELEEHLDAMDGLVEAHRRGEHLAPLYLLHAAAAA